MSKKQNKSNPERGAVMAVKETAVIKVTKSDVMKLVVRGVKAQWIRDLRDAEHEQFLALKAYRAVLEKSAKSRYGKRVEGLINLAGLDIRDVKWKVHNPDTEDKLSKVEIKIGQTWHGHTGIECQFPVPCTANITKLYDTWVECAKVTKELHHRDRRVATLQSRVNDAMTEVNLEASSEGQTLLDAIEGMAKAVQPKLVAGAKS